MAAGTIELTGLNYLADGIGNKTNLKLEVWSLADPTAEVLDSITLATDGSDFTAASGGVIDLASWKTFTLTNGELVDTIRLYSGAIKIASVTLTTDNNFPAGGELIVKKYEITVA